MLCIDMATATTKLLLVLLREGLELLMLTKLEARRKLNFKLFSHENHKKTLGNNMWYICSESRNFCLDALHKEIMEQKLCNGSTGRLLHNKI